MNWKHWPLLKGNCLKSPWASVKLNLPFTLLPFLDDKGEGYLIPHFPGKIRSIGSLICWKSTSNTKWCCSKYLQSIRFDFGLLFTCLSKRDLSRILIPYLPLTTRISDKEYAFEHTHFYFSLQLRILKLTTVFPILSSLPWIKCDVEHTMETFHKS